MNGFDSKGLSRNPVKTLPPGWRWVRLGEICKVTGGSTPGTHVQEYWNGAVVWVTPADLGRLSSIVISDSDRKISHAGFRSCGLQMLPVGTVVMSSRAPIGHLAVAGVPLCTNQGCKSFLPGPSVQPLFLYWSLRRMIPSIKALGNGPTFTEVSKSILERFQIPLPPISEQKRIAKTLTEQMEAVEKARNAVQAQLDAANALSAACLREIFPQPGQKLHSSWHWIRFGEICRIAARQVDPRIPEYARLLHVSPEDIDSGTGRLLELQSASEDGMVSGKYLFEAGNILYSKIRPYLKKAAVTSFKGLCSADIYPLEVVDVRADPRFVLWVLLSQPFTEYAVAESRRARMPKLNRTQLFSYMAPIPPLKEQERIAAEVTEQMATIEKLRVNLEAQLIEIKSLSASVLRKAFRGDL